jgi:hypothetical protein
MEFLLKKIQYTRGSSTTSASHTHTLTLLQSSYLALRNQNHPTKTLFSPSKNT